MYLYPMLVLEKLGNKILNNALYVKKDDVTYWWFCSTRMWTTQPRWLWVDCSPARSISSPPEPQTTRAARTTSLHLSHSQHQVRVVKCMDKLPLFPLFIIGEELYLPSQMHDRANLILYFYNYNLCLTSLDMWCWRSSCTYIIKPTVWVKIL